MKMRIFLMGLCLLALVGCATSTSYVNYAHEHFAPKDQFYAINVYPDSQSIGTANPYYVIGRVSIEGYASYGVTPGSLSLQAQKLARKRGADAIINAKTTAYRYYDGDTILRFTGELIVFSSSVPK